MFINNVCPRNLTLNFSLSIPDYYIIWLILRIPILICGLATYITYYLLSHRAIAYVFPSPCLPPLTWIPDCHLFWLTHFGNDPSPLYLLMISPCPAELLYINLQLEKALWSHLTTLMRNACPYLLHQRSWMPWRVSWRAVLQRTLRNRRIPQLLLRGTRLHLWLTTTLDAIDTLNRIIRVDIEVDLGVEVISRWLD